MKNRKTEEVIFRVLMNLSTLIIIFTLFIIIISVFKKGLPALNLEMITQVPKGGYYYGREGGVLNAIIGSLYLSVGSVFLALIISLPVAMYINIYLIKHSKLVNSIRFLLDLLWGVPSIVYGSLGFTIMIMLGLRTSLLAGILTVTIFIIPIMVRAMDEVLKTVPKGLLEASLSLGATKSESAYRVVIRQVLPGIVTAVLLSFGRAIGDAASVLFTTGYTDNIPVSLNEPSASLPLSIFFQLSSPIQEVKDRAFASAAILTIIILAVSILSRANSKRFEKNKINF